MFDTKIVIIVRDDIEDWKKMNVVAFMASGIIGQYPEIIGGEYVDADGNVFNALAEQPMIVLKATASVLSNIHKRAQSRDIRTSVFIEEMFTTAHDQENREMFKKFTSDNANIVGVGLRADKKIADKITKGAKMYS